MASAQLMPFKAKAEERATKPLPDTEAPVKKQCTQYEKQIQKMDGDPGLVKDFNQRFLFNMGQECWGVYFKEQRRDRIWT